MTGFLKTSLYSGLLFVFLSLYKFPFAPEIAIGHWVSLACFKNRIQGFVWTNLLLALFAGMFFVATPLSILAPTQYWGEIVNQHLGETGFWGRTGLTGIVLVLSYGIYFLLFRFFLRFRMVSPAVVIALLILFGVVVLKSYVWPAGVSLVLLGLLLYLSKSFWMCAYQFSEVDLLKKYPVHFHFSASSPLWQQTWARTSVPRGFGDFLNTETSSQRTEVTLRSGVRLFLWALILQQISIHLYKICFLDADSNGWGFSAQGLFMYPRHNLLDLTFENWMPLLASLLMRTAIFLLFLAHTSHAIVAIARFYGFDVRKNFDNPFRAQSFNEFFARAFHYYISILQRIFFYPLWARLKGIRNKYLRIFVVSWLTIFGGGLAASYLRKIALLDQLSLQDYFISSIHDRSYYFLALAFAIAISSTWGLYRSKRRLTGERKSSRFFAAAKVAMYFLIFAICFSLQNFVGVK